jgi:hypothetical protein
MKALVQDKMRDWTLKLGSSLGISCLEMTGDTAEFYEKKAIHDSDLILTTPEVPCHSLAL